MQIGAHLAGGIVLWTVRDGQGVGCATSEGEAFYSGEVSERMRAVVEALAEWHRTDRSEYEGESARKVSRELRSRSV